MTEFVVLQFLKTISNASLTTTTTLSPPPPLQMASHATTRTTAPHRGVFFLNKLTTMASEMAAATAAVGARDAMVHFFPLFLHILYLCSDYLEIELYVRTHRNTTHEEAEVFFSSLSSNSG